MAKGIKPKTPKPKKCPICSTEYLPWSSTQKVCSDWQCGLAFSRQQEGEKQARKIRKQEKLQRIEWNKRKADLKPLKHWEDLTQRVVNDFIRLRDKHLPCISCGTWETVQWEAGHYRSRKAASQIRYNEDNIHKQCHRCNVELSANQQQYRIFLMAKIGAQRVEAIENNNTPHRYTREELCAIRAHYRALLRVINKQREAA